MASVKQAAKRLWVLCLFVVVLCAAATADLFYVDDDAVSGGDGGSWNRAFCCLSDALSAASSGDEIRVAQGIYYPHLSCVSDANEIDRDQSFHLPSGVRLLGGYAGWDAVDPNDWNVSQFPSVLSGDMLGNDGPAFAGYEENCYHVLVASQVDEKTLLDGFFIVHGNADGSDFDRTRAGGLLLKESRLRVRHCTFLENAGLYDAAVLNDNESDPEFLNCRFLGSKAQFDGGAAGNRGKSRAIYVNCLFSGNTAGRQGGAVYEDSQSSSVFINCTLSGNNALALGGAVYINNGSTPALINSIFWGNSDTAGQGETSQIAIQNASVTLRYCCVQGWSGVLGGIGNIGENPLFVDADGLDNRVGTVDDDLRLMSESPCVDRGDPSVVTIEIDLSGQSRNQEETVDMGAYEFSPMIGLIAHWGLDEITGPTARDETASADGEAIGNRLWRPHAGRIGGSLQFDGLGDYVDCGDGMQFDIRNSITVCAWIKVDQFDRQFQAIVTKGDNSFRLQRYSDTRCLEFACTGVVVPGAEWSNIWGSIPVDDGLWHHAAGVYDGQTMSLYVDGQLDTSEEASGLIDISSYPVLIGENAQQPRRYWNGFIDDVRIYNYPLSETEIRQFVNMGRTWHVHPDGNIENDGFSPDSALPGIQEAIDLAADGDRVLVWPGVYQEGIDFQGKAITVTSATDAAVLEIPNGWAVSFHRGEGPQSILSNFVIRYSQYAVFTWMASPTLRNLTIVGCEFGIDAREGAHPDIRNCIFWNNLYSDLSQDDISQCRVHYCWLRNQIEPAPVAWWTFDEGYGQTAYDRVGGNHGLISGAQWTGGIVGLALSFDGQRDSVYVEDHPSLRLGNRDYSISLWIKPRIVTGTGTLVAKVEGMSNKEFMLSLEEKELRLDVERNENNGRATSPASIQPDRWQHVVVTFDADLLQPTFYLDTQPQISGSWGDSPISALPDCLYNDLVIGLRGGAYEGYGFDGLIDEVMLFDRVLTPEQVKMIYLKGLGPVFADPDKGDFHLKSEHGRYWIPDSNELSQSGLWILDAISSPCIDAGDPQEEPINEPQPHGGRINMGAYGGSLSASRSHWPLRGDTNRDGRVDLQDMAILAEEWLLDAFHAR
ncbi:MAG: hypothetical protein JW828_01920 [Sedimentisphaerales bacterium]|nr:hypothetical protein [Sedimentisphaerales bacterium]